MEENNATDEEFTDIFIKTGRIQYIIMALIMSGFILFGKEFITSLSTSILQELMPILAAVIAFVTIKVIIQY